MINRPLARSIIRSDRLQFFAYPKISTCRSSICAARATKKSGRSLPMTSELHLNLRGTLTAPAVVVVAMPSLSSFRSIGANPKCAAERYFAAATTTCCRRSSLITARPLLSLSQLMLAFRARSISGHPIWSSILDSRSAVVGRPRYTTR